jgi:hypothetical protein
VFIADDEGGGDEGVLSLSLDSFSIFIFLLIRDSVIEENGCVESVSLTNLPSDILSFKFKLLSSTSEYLLEDNVFLKCFNNSCLHFGWNRFRFS